MSYALEPVVLTASQTLTYLANQGETIVVNKADGWTITLPAATGTGMEVEVVVGTTISSNSGVITVTGDDTFIGVISSATATTGAGTHEAAAGTDDTITMNGTTTGGIAGTSFRFRDIAADKWLVMGHMVGSGSLASPLSGS